MSAVGAVCLLSGGLVLPVELIMNTVFSYIVQKRLSQENENVATEALAFVLSSSERARAGLLTLLRGISPELPSLRFRTQQTEGSARPDMWGIDDDKGTPRVFIENKFWAGFTRNQPVEYLKLLATYPSPTLLLLVVPAKRLETVWNGIDGIRHRLQAANVAASSRSASAHIPYVVATDSGPLLAITSWTKVLSAIELGLNESAEDVPVSNDLLQLRALCEAADLDSARPFSSTDLTNQNTPDLVLQLSSVVQLAVAAGVSRGTLSIRGLLPMANWERAGRYLRFANAAGFGAWFGTDFRRWRERGSTPLWLVFSPSFGRGSEARTVLEPWAAQRGLPCAVETDGYFAVGIAVVPDEEQDAVVGSIVDCLGRVGVELSKLPAKSEPDTGSDESTGNP